MQLKQLKVTNFRCYQDETVIDLDDLVVLVGKNDAGKSSLFEALDIFFEGKAAPDQDDPCVHTDDHEVRITCAFTDSPQFVVIDAQHRTTLASAYLLNGCGLLEIIKVYNCNLSKPRCSGIFARALHPTADGYDDLLSLTNTKLKQRAKSLRVDLTDVNQTINTELRQAIWSHTDDLKCQEVEIELRAQDAKAIWDQIKGHLPIFALFKSDRPSTDQDAEAQDPMKSAVREAIRTQEESLEQIAQEVRDKVQEIADRTVEKIEEMNPELARQLTPRVTTKKWDTLFSVNLTGDEDIPINKRGSGTRRLVLLNFFRAKAEKDSEDRDTGIIYAIEEPETSQHPYNQVMLIKALEDLADQAGCQVLLSTHTPVLARRFSQDALRLIALDGVQPTIRYGKDETTVQAIVNSLGVLPDHSVRVFLGVEGRNDIMFLRTISKILHATDNDIPDLAQEEDSGCLVFVPLGGSNLDLWISRLKEFDRPEFYLIDRDVPPPGQAKYETTARRLQARDNCTVWITGRKELENYIHHEIIRHEYADYRGVGDAFENVPELFAQAVHQSSESESAWQDVMMDSEKLAKKASKAKRRLNSEIVGRMTPELLSDIDANDEVRTWLRELGIALRSDAANDQRQAP